MFFPTPVRVLLCNKVAIRLGNSDGKHESDEGGREREDKSKR